VRSHVKKLIRIQTDIAPYGVGNGFSAQTLFSLRRMLACLLLVSGVGLFVQPYAALGTQAAQSGPNQLPAYKPLRYEEDYSYLKDPRRRTDFWDALKYIPLGNREGWYFSLGGEIRERYEFFHNEEAKSQPADRHGNNSYALQRYLLHGDLHLGARLRFFAQIMSGLEDGRIGGPRPDIDRDIFDVHQAFRLHWCAGYPAPEPFNLCTSDDAFRNKS